jgi:bifunctional enzyme CysN/CysC/sulfate adenylyltransferase subunit 1
MEVKKISLLGHKDHGKSTLIGSMLMQTGAATKVRIEEAKRYSKKKGKDFEPAFILDSLVEEREQEMTYDTTRAQMKYKNHAFEFIDVPGHEELIKNMISGASYGDVALLMVSALPDEGIKDQTKRHVFLAKMLGIENLIVAVNKMDMVGYDKKRFTMIKENLSEFLKRINFNLDKVEFIPISAYKGENLTKKSNKIKWYAGKCLADVLCNETKEEPKDNKLRVLVQGMLEDKKNMYITGKIISGKLGVKDEIKAFPSGAVYEVDQIIVKNKKAKTAKSGENIAIKVEGKINEAKGSLMFPKSEKVIPVKEAKSLIFFVRKPGKDITANLYGNKVKCMIKIDKLVETASGREVKRGIAKPLEAAHSTIRLENPMIIEKYDKNRELGRFTLSDENGFFGIGIREG